MREGVGWSPLALEVARFGGVDLDFIAFCLQALKILREMIIFHVECQHHFHCLPPLPLQSFQETLELLLDY